MRVLFAISLLAVLSGCARSDRVLNRPIIDMSGVNPEVYRADLAECGQYANEVATGAKVLAGAAGGAVIGGATGAILGDSDRAKRSAGVGAVWGGAHGAAKGHYERGRVIKNCLRNRGYAVLN